MAHTSDVARIESISNVHQLLLASGGIGHQGLETTVFPGRCSPAILIRVVCRVIGTHGREVLWYQLVDQEETEFCIHTTAITGSLSEYFLPHQPVPLVESWPDDARYQEPTPL